jgi:lipopolysaccharide biosynthesis regulator YciM
VGWLKRVFRGGERAPGDVDTALREALLAVLDHDLDRAEVLIVRAVGLDSKAVEPHLALARLYRMRGEIGRAIRVHQNLLLRADLAPEQATAGLADLAADFQHGGFLQRAIASYEEVLAREPKHRAALRALVALHASARDYRRAIEVARRLAKLEKRDVAGQESALLVEMAQAAQAEGRSDDARRTLKRALRRDPRSVQGWIELGAVEAERARAKAALAAWSRVPAIDPASGPLVYPRLEATYTTLGRSADYEAYLRAQLQERPEDGGARLALARALAARRETGEAVAELRRVLERDPDDLEARAMVGRLLLADGREAEAAKAYAELLDVLERRGLLHATEGLA